MRRTMVPLLASTSALCALLVTGGGAAALPAAAIPPVVPGEYDAAVSTPVEDPYYPSKGDPGFDALHYDLDLSWAPKSRTLTGVATIQLRSVTDQDQLTLDLGKALTPTAVTLDGTPVTYTHPGQHLVVDPVLPLPADSRHELVVDYAGTPEPFETTFHRSDISELGWHTRKDGSTWTMQEPFGAFTWYPVNDHPSDKAFYSATVSAPARMVGVFNGELVEDTETDGRRVTSWELASPAASYLVTLAIGDFVHYDDQSTSGVPISYWLPRGHTDKVLRVARFLPDAMQWLEKRLGPYPFDRAGILGTRGGSGMETQTLISLNQDILQYGARSVILHELAHHWYGDTVTPDNWKDLWLNEGWAMYAEIRWTVDHGDFTMGEWRRYLADADGDLRRQDGPPGEYHPRDFATGSVYYSAALMVDQLRKKLGTDAFADLWRAWPQQHRDSNADRDDYIAWASKRSGVDLRPFITKWLTSETTPHLL